MDKYVKLKKATVDLPLDPPKLRYKDLFVIILPASCACTILTGFLPTNLNLKNFTYFHYVAFTNDK
ncbi:DNA repair photolyase [Candidatus Scalindua japonica]|uniref:DNA repair photolyase n=1 Tax=Candidatus Scalindua japonica TaxID=1284222 RepID=A0A286TTW6_9BACT|nr:DNA repair photolyase [Candidatus Scalindua japonica]